MYGFWFILSLTNTYAMSEGGRLGPPPDPPCQVRLVTSGSSPGILQRAVLNSLTHCHSSYRHGSHTVGMGIIFKGLLL